MMVRQKAIPGLLDQVESIPRQKKLKTPRKGVRRSRPFEAETRLAMWRHHQLDRELDEVLRSPRS